MSGGPISYFLFLKKGIKHLKPLILIIFFKMKKKSVDCLGFGNILKVPWPKVNEGTRPSNKTLRVLTRKSIVIHRNENRAIWRNWKSKFTRFLKPAEFDCLANTRTRWLILNKRISETLSGIKRLLVRRLLAPCKEIIRSLYYWSFEWNRTSLILPFLLMHRFV